VDVGQRLRRALGRSGRRKLILADRQPEQVAHDRHPAVQAVVGEVLQAQRRLVEQAVDDRPRDLVDALAVPR
jgi:hypothetical protein